MEPHGAAGCFLSESELSLWGRAETSRAVKEKRDRRSPPRHSEQECEGKQETPRGMARHAVPSV